MTATRLNFIIDAGASWNESMTWSGQNITGRAIRMQLKRKYDGVVEIELTEINGRIVIVDAPNGQFTINLDAEETSLLIGEYVYDIDLVSESDATDIVKLVRGFVYVNNRVTS